MCVPPIAVLPHTDHTGALLGVQSGYIMDGLLDSHGACQIKMQTGHDNVSAGKQAGRGCKIGTGRGTERDRERAHLMHLSWMGEIKAGLNLSLSYGLSLR